MRVASRSPAAGVIARRRDEELGLAERAAAGDPRARRRVVVLVHRRVRAVANSLLDHAADADDAAQIALLEILASIGSFRGEGSLVSWAARLAVRHVRRVAMRRRSTRDRQAPLVDEPPAAEPEPRRSDDLPRSLRSYLGELPDDQREALVLRYALGFKLEEVADVTDTPVSTVRGRIRAGMGRLRATIAREQRFGSGQR